MPNRRYGRILLKFNIFVNIPPQIFNRIVTVVRKFFPFHARKEHFGNSLICGVPGLENDCRLFSFYKCFLEMSDVSCAPV